jgi:hypothetical protein
MMVKRLGDSVQIRSGQSKRTFVVANLTGMWLADTAMRGMTAEQAMKLLNAATGRRYNYKRAWEWKSGKRALPAVARAAMLRTSLPYILKCFGLSLPPQKSLELASFLT